jgi:hypothetical protein
VRWRVADFETDDVLRHFESLDGAPIALFVGVGKSLELRPEGGHGDRGINAARFIAAFMPRKPLDALEGANAQGSCRGWGLHPRRLPHGECAVWGRAPGSGRLRRSCPTLVNDRAAIDAWRISAATITVREHRNIRSADRTHRSRCTTKSASGRFNPSSANQACPSLCSSKVQHSGLKRKRFVFVSPAPKGHGASHRTITGVAGTVDRSRRRGLSPIDSPTCSSTKMNGRPPISSTRRSLRLTHQLSARSYDWWPCSAASWRAKVTASRASKPSGSGCSASWTASSAFSSSVRRLRGELCIRIPD